MFPPPPPAQDKTLQLRDEHGRLYGLAGGWPLRTLSDAGRHALFRPREWRPFHAPRLFLET